ncbi:MAG: hypothetical protein WCI87_05665 [Euryarchaeota archaeon]
MRFLITIKLFETVTGAEIVRVQQEMGEQLQYMLGTGQVVASGTFADTRGGFFLVDVDEEEDFLGLLGTAILDNFAIESHPIVPFETVVEMQKKLYGPRI